MMDVIETPPSTTSLPPVRHPRPINQSERLRNYRPTADELVEQFGSWQTGGSA